MVVDYLSAVEEDRDVITFRKKLKPIAGTVLATLLLQQMIFRAKNEDYEPFYKFKEPCGNPLYRVGDSWIEETTFSPDEFDGALKRIAVRTVKSKAHEVYPHSMITYWTDMNHVTWYWVNRSVIAQRLEAHYKDLAETRKVGLVREVKSSSGVKPENQVSLFTENTTETTQRLTTPSLPKNGNSVGSPPPAKKESKPKKLFALNFNTDMSARVLRHFHDLHRSAMPEIPNELQDEWKCVRKWQTEANNDEEMMMQALDSVMSFFNQKELDDAGIWSFDKQMKNAIRKIKYNGTKVVKAQWQ